MPGVVQLEFIPDIIHTIINGLLPARLATVRRWFRRSRWRRRRRRKHLRAEGAQRCVFQIGQQHGGLQVQSVHIFEHVSVPRISRSGRLPIIRILPSRKKTAAATVAAVAAAAAAAATAAATRHPFECEPEQYHPARSCVIHLQLFYRIW